MRTFFQVPGTGLDWFTESTSPSSDNMPPSETTGSEDITKESDEVNRLKENISTPNQKEDGVLIADNEIVPKDGRGSRMYVEVDAPKEVTSENMWERTDVLAGQDTFPKNLQCVNI